MRTPVPVPLPKLLPHPFSSDHNTEPCFKEIKHVLSRLSHANTIIQTKVYLAIPRMGFSVHSRQKLATLFGKITVKGHIPADIFHEWEVMTDNIVNDEDAFLDVGMIQHVFVQI